jgi:hypothetical protein
MIVSNVFEIEFDFESKHTPQQMLTQERRALMMEGISSNFVGRKKSKYELEDSLT